MTAPKEESQPEQPPHFQLVESDKTTAAPEEGSDQSQQTGEKDKVVVPVIRVLGKVRTQ